MFECHKMNPDCQVYTQQIQDYIVCCLSCISLQIDLGPIYMEVGIPRYPSHPVPQDTFVTHLYENIEAR